MSNPPFNETQYQSDTQSARVEILDLSKPLLLSDMFTRKGEDTSSFLGETCEDMTFPRTLKGKTTYRTITVYNCQQYGEHMIVDGWEDITAT